MYIFLLLTAYLIIAATILLTAFFLVVGVSFYLWGNLKGAPYVRSKKEKIRVMLELAGIKSGETVLDLGSGDGSLVIEAARLGAHATGIEINPFLVWHARLKIKKFALSERGRVVRSDFYRYSTRDADVIFLYLWPPTIEALKEKFERELKPGARIISNTFPITGWRPIMEKDNVFLYQYGGRDSTT